MRTLAPAVLRSAKLVARGSGLFKILGENAVADRDRRSPRPAQDRCRARRPPWLRGQHFGDSGRAGREPDGHSRARPDRGHPSWSDLHLPLLNCGIGPAQQCGARGQYAHPNGPAASAIGSSDHRLREHGIEGSNRPGTLIAIPRSLDELGRRKDARRIAHACRWSPMARDTRDGPRKTREGVHQQSTRSPVSRKYSA